MFNNDRKIFLNKFEKIVNKIYDTHIAPKKRNRPINYEELKDLKVDINLCAGLAMKNNKIDFDKFLKFFKKYC